MKHLDLFSGIGGFALAAREVWGDEHEIVAFCDSDWFCRQVLAKNFPGAKIHEDIRALTNTDHPGRQGQDILQQRRTGDRGRIESVSLVTGGFPCQPFSQAGRRRGTDDDRYLWPEMLRIIREFQPAWVIAENVGGLVTWSDGLVLETVCADMEVEGYEVQPFIIPAAAVGAPHRRDRVWFVAHAVDSGQGRAERRGVGASQKISSEHRTQNSTARKSERTDSHTHRVRPSTTPQIDPAETRQPPLGDAARRHSYATDARRLRKPARGGETVRSEGQEPKQPHHIFPDWNRHWQEVALATCNVRMDDGFSRRMVRLPDGTRVSEAKWQKEAIKAYGNAIVPQVAMEIMKAIKEASA